MRKNKPKVRDEAKTLNIQNERVAPPGWTNNSLVLPNTLSSKYCFEDLCTLLIGTVRVCNVIRACKWCFGLCTPNEACSVPVLLGKHFSPLPCKHVCIPTVFPCHCLHGDPGHLLYLSPPFITVTCGPPLCCLKAVVEPVLRLRGRRRFESAPGEALKPETLTGEVCLKLISAPGSDCWSNNWSSEWQRSCYRPDADLKNKRGGSQSCVFLIRGPEDKVSRHLSSPPPLLLLLLTLWVWFQLVYFYSFCVFFSRRLSLIAAVCDGEDTLTQCDAVKTLPPFQRY